MNISSQVLAIVIICFILVAAVSLVRSVSTELRNIPGPAFAALTSYYRVLLLWRGQGPIEYYKLHQKYGTVVRIGPNHVLVSDPTMIPVIYDSRHKLIKVGHLRWKSQIIHSHADTTR